MTSSKIAIFNITTSWPNSKVNAVSIDRIIENPILKIFSLLAMFYMIITSTIAPKPYIEPLISRESKYLQSLKLHLKPALICRISSDYLHIQLCICRYNNRTCLGDTESSHRELHILPEIKRPLVVCEVYSDHYT